MRGSRTAGIARRVALTLGAVVLLLGIQAIGMSAAADAATSRSAAPVAEAPQAVPATTPTGVFYTYYYNCIPNTCTSALTCRAGNHQPPAWLSLGEQPLQVINGCNVRVWLSQYSDGTGYKLCISPGDGPINIYRPYRNIGVSTNSSRC